MIRKILLWGIIAIVAFIWFTTVFKSCGGGTTNPLSKAKTNIENTVDGLTSDDDSDEFEGEADGEGDDESLALNRASDGEGDDEEEGGDKPEDYDEDEDGEEDTARALAKRATTAAGTAASTADTKASSATTNTKPSATRTGSAAGNNSRYIVVAGAFSTQDNANIELKRLKRMGYNDSEIFRFSYSDYYNVGVGRYNSYKQANSRLTSLKKDGVESYIHRKRAKKLAFIWPPISSFHCLG